MPGSDQLHLQRLLRLGTESGLCLLCGICGLDGVMVLHCTTSWWSRCRHRTELAVS